MVSQYWEPRRLFGNTVAEMGRETVVVIHYFKWEDKYYWSKVLLEHIVAQVVEVTVD